MEKNLITVRNCRIENSRETLVPQVDWEFKGGEAWLVIGPNGGGKADFLNAISGSINCKMIPNENTVAAGNANGPEVSLYSSVFGDSVEIVSLERAARLIEEERNNDESEYIDGGVDIGRTGRVFIAQGILEANKDAYPSVGSDFKAQVQADKAILKKVASEVDKYEEIKLCGIEKILDRGLKYMSTGEIRRTLLARALISGKKLLILSDPFAGLDVNSRKILLDFFDSIADRQLKDKDGDFPRIILGMERWHEIPEAITNVLEFSNKKISFCGARKDYEKLLESKQAEKSAAESSMKEKLADELKETYSENVVLQRETNTQSVDDKPEILVQMNNVNVGWDDHKVLVDLNWQLNKGEHWLIQGPNGSGKTTFLELITGDCRQVFSNDVWLFGNKRGTGETIWEIKAKLGIVSYRLHVEYRMLGGTSLLNVIVSGFRDSIGLYGSATDVETSAAKRWLALGGFSGRENETFGNLSYGEQRAILILRSAVKCPEILILDEPCHGLDEQYREKILHLMNLIGENGTSTMLHVTHDPSEVLDCEKHILELHPGESPMYVIKNR